MLDEPVTVLLVRINCYAELANTSEAVDAVAQNFPECQLFAVSSPTSEALDLVRSDPRIASVRMIADLPGSPIARAAGLFKSLHSIPKLRATVIFYGATYGLTYGKHLVRGLMFGGRKYLIGPNRQLVPARSPAGIREIIQIFAGMTVDAAGTSAVRRQYPPRRKSAKTRSELLSPGDRVLMIRLDSIGDVVATLPIMQAVSKKIGCPVDVLVRRHTGTLLTCLPFIGKIYTYHAVQFAHSDPACRALVEDMRRKNYDTTLELTGNSPTARLFALLADAKTTAGLRYDSVNLTTAKNIRFDLQMDGYVGHGGYTARAERVIEQLGIDGPIQGVLLPVSESDLRAVQTLLAKIGVADRYAVMHMNGSTKFKSWRTERFAEVANHLSAKYGLAIVLTGVESDLKSTEEMRSMCDQPSRIYSLAGVLGLQSLPALFTEAAIVVTVDTGPAHIAAATIVPLVVLGMPENAPFGRGGDVVSPDEARVADDRAFPLHAIQTEQVLIRIDTLLA